MALQRHHRTNPGHLGLDNDGHMTDQHGRPLVRGRLEGVSAVAHPGSFRVTRHRRDRRRIVEALAGLVHVLHDDGRGQCRRTDRQAGIIRAVSKAAYAIRDGLALLIVSALACEAGYQNRRSQPRVKRGGDRSPISPSTTSTRSSVINRLPSSTAHGPIRAERPGEAWFRCLGRIDRR